ARVVLDAAAGDDVGHDRQATNAAPSEAPARSSAARLRLKQAFPAGVDGSTEEVARDRQLDNPIAAAWRRAGAGGGRVEAKPGRRPGGPSHRPVNRGSRRSAAALTPSRKSLVTNSSACSAASCAVA